MSASLTTTLASKWPLLVALVIGLILGSLFHKYAIDKAETENIGLFRSHNAGTGRALPSGFQQKMKADVAAVNQCVSNNPTVNADTRGKMENYAKAVAALPDNFDEAVLFRTIKAQCGIWNWNNFLAILSSPCGEKFRNVMPTCSQ